MKKALALCLAALTALITVPAYAADVEFSFEGGRNPWAGTPRAGKITGVLYGLNDDGFSAPTGIRTVPAAGAVSPASTRSRVDLPTPDGPTTAVKEPRSSSAVKPDSTGGAAP